jgi:alpha-beta hydrolase superfamily lysophospholipase
MRRTAYADVHAAWRDYLRRYNHGRPVVLIGHSQGTLVLRQLVAREVDAKPRVRALLVSALLLGGNVLVAQGRETGGDLRHVPACRSPRQF